MASFPGGMLYCRCPTPLYPESTAQYIHYASCQFGVFRAVAKLFLSLIRPLQAMPSELAAQRDNCQLCPVAHLLLPKPYNRICLHSLQAMPSELAAQRVSYADFKQFRDMWRQLHLLSGE